MLREMSPSFGPTCFSTGNAPPTPPHNDPLDDIYGSDSGSPVLASQDPLSPSVPQNQNHEILSDLPSRQRALDTDAYREGLANSKGEFVQEGFDEGYSLGANLGVNVGYILGVLQGFVTGWKGHDKTRFEESRQMWGNAQKELAIQELLSQKWVNEEGIWTWDVEGSEGDVTFKEVADQHPIIKRWMKVVEETATKWGVDLEAVEKSHGAEEEQQS